MKNIILIVLVFILAIQLQAQNVGIGISNPLYKLDVAGFVRNSNTTMTSPGLFGRLTSGGSLRVENNDNSKFLVIDGSSIQAQLGSQTGSGTSASPLLLNVFGGNVGIGISSPNASLSVNRGKGVDGTAAFFGTDHVSHFNYNIAENTYIRAGKSGSTVYLNDTHYGDVNIATGGGNIQTGNSIYSTQTGGLNIVPLGIISYNIKINSNGDIVQADIVNEAGNIATGAYSSSAITLEDDLVNIDIALNEGVYFLYNKVIAIGANGFFNNNIGIGKACNSSTTGVFLENGVKVLRIFYAADSFSLINPALSGTFIIYGIK